METDYCRHCDSFLTKRGKRCPDCQGLAPWIESYCPSCSSESYVLQPYGFDKSRALAGGLVAGPLGLLSGFLGASDIECICLECRQGWLISPTNGVSPTRKFKEIPEECF